MTNNFRLSIENLLSVSEMMKVDDVILASSSHLHCPCTVILNQRRFGTTWFNNVGVVTLIIAHPKTWKKFIPSNLWFSNRPE